MADNVQTYILRVNISCCNACPKTLKKLLLKNKGVEKFDVDQDKSIVSVTGTLNLYQLIRDIKKKINKNAELIKKESSDPEKKEPSDSKNKQQSEKPQEQMAPAEQVSKNFMYCPCTEHMPMPQQHPGYYYPRMMAWQPPPYGYYGYPHY